jgi:conjugal transfer pilus assembly protein TraF
MLILSSTVSSNCLSASWYDAKEQGWMWYKALPQPKKANKKSPLSSKSSPSSLTARDQVKKIQEAFEESTAKSILDPTLPNVAQTIKLQRLIVDRASKFSDMWMLANLLDTDNFDPASHDNAAYRELRRKEEEKLLNAKLKVLSKHYGLFFVFKSSCPYCHRFAPLVKEFASTFGFEVKAISADGGVINEFKNASRDNGALKVINPQGVYPALFLANPKTMQIIPIAWGMVSITELKENCRYILTMMEQKHGK